MDLRNTMTNDHHLSTWLEHVQELSAQHISWEQLWSLHLRGVQIRDELSRTLLYAERPVDLDEKQDMLFKGENILRSLFITIPTEDINLNEIQPK